MTSCQRLRRLFRKRWRTYPRSVKKQDKCVSNSIFQHQHAALGRRLGPYFWWCQEGSLTSLQERLVKTGGHLLKHARLLLTKSPVALAPRQHAAEHRDADAATYQRCTATRRGLDLNLETSWQVPPTGRPRSSPTILSTTTGTMMYSWASIPTQGSSGRCLKRSRRLKSESPPAAASRC